MLDLAMLPRHDRRSVQNSTAVLRNWYLVEPCPKTAKRIDRFTQAPVWREQHALTIESVESTRKPQKDWKVGRRVIARSAGFIVRGRWFDSRCVCRLTFRSKSRSSSRRAIDR